MSKGRINNSYYLRYGLVVLITLAFVVATYFIVNPKTSCEAQGKVNDPTPGLNRCLEPCKQDSKDCSKENCQDYRCKTDKCKARYDINTAAVVCSDCEIGKIPLKEEGKNTYNCVPECNNKENSNWVCSDGETCKNLSEGDTGSPSYCAKNLYKCVQDVGNRGHYCKAVTPGSGGVPLNECLNNGTTDGTACSCNHTQGYALNSKNTACSTIACTLDGLNGWGSNQDPSRNDPTKKKPIEGKMSLDPNPNTGTCYALDDENGLLLDPKADKSKKCTDNKTQENCNNMNAEGWKCKWLPRLRSCSPNPPTNCLIKKGFVPPDKLIRYGDDIILSIDNKLFNESRLLFSCGRCSDYDGSKTNTDPMTFVGKYGGESSPVRTETITFKIVPTFSPKDNQNQKQKYMGKVLNTNDAFHLRAKYGDSNTNKPSYYYLTEAKCTPRIYGLYYNPNSTFTKTGAIGYTSLSLASSGTDQTVPTTTFRFVDPSEDNKCTSTGPACNQDSNQVTTKQAYRLKFSKSSPNPSYYVELGDNTDAASEVIIEGQPFVDCKTNFFVTFGPKSKTNTNWFIMKPQSIVQAQCPHFFKKNGTAKTNEEIGGYNPADAYLGLTGTKRLHPFNDMSLYALILALLIVAILVFTVRQR